MNILKLSAILRMGERVGGKDWGFFSVSLNKGIYITGSPLRGIAVLLAGNPRVATLPTQYTWDQADFQFGKMGI